jgi:hypothetical protein
LRIIRCWGKKGKYTTMVWWIVKRKRWDIHIMICMISLHTLAHATTQTRLQRLKLKTQREKKEEKKNLKFHKTWRRSWVLRGRNWKKFKFTSVLSLSFAYISISFPSFFHSIVSMEQQRTTTDEEKNSLNFSPQLLF